MLGSPRPPGPSAPRLDPHALRAWGFFGPASRHFMIVPSTVLTKRLAAG